MVVNLSECDQRKDFGILYMAWMSRNLHGNIVPGHTIDSNHGQCWSSLRLACKLVELKGL